MEGAEVFAEQLENISLSQFRAENGSSESPCTASGATAADFYTAGASERATTSHAAFVTAGIELSKYHWSERVEVDTDSTDDEIATDNLEVFQTLQQHPRWGHFFRTFGYGTEIADSIGEMVVGEKFAEGGQAELFSAHITWRSAWYEEYCKNAGLEWVLKVFKRGTLLRQLQSQWPQGYLEWWANLFERDRLKYPLGLRWQCDVKYGTLMRDGRFAFFMGKESRDLRSHIDENMVGGGDGVGPFSKVEDEDIIYRIARGVEWLHKQNIVHRDMKASNVLVTGGVYLIADFECSVGVVGTRFWRAPEILQACKDRTVNQRPELFSKASDVYGYGMTCYEVLTGKYPFQDEGVTMSDVIKGKQPCVPGFVDTKYKHLLRWCWRLDPAERPSFDEILGLLESDSKSQQIRKWKMERMKVYEGGHALLGCRYPSHRLMLVECGSIEAGGSYACKLCLEKCNGEVYHCTSCGDFDLHLECARIHRHMTSFLHAHELEVLGPYNHHENHVCDGCLEDLVGSQWTYRCSARGCDFDLHARCGKYAKTISHASHEEHTLLLIFNLVVTSVNESMIVCDGCKMGIRPNELVYHCKECNFNIHPNCALGKLVSN